MTFLEPDIKGISRNLLDATLNGEPLHLHISEIGPGQRAHPPHQHGGLEAIYVLDGEGTFEIDGETKRLGANEAVVFDPRKMHGLLNESRAATRYMVVLAEAANP